MHKLHKLIKEAGIHINQICRYSNILLNRVFSKTLPNTANKETGLWFSKSCLSPFPCSGTILDFFHESENIPVSMQFL